MDSARQLDLSWYGAISVAAFHDNHRLRSHPVSSSPTQAPSKSATRWVVALTGIGSLMAALDTLVVSTR
jgi:hypothetical protein